MPLHKISEIIQKVNVMYDKALQLHRKKYGGDGVVGGEYNRTEVDALVADIQALAGEIYNDNAKHPKLVEKDSNREENNK